MNAPKPSRPSSRAIVTKKTSEVSFATISPLRRASALRAMRCDPLALMRRLLSGRDLARCSPAARAAGAARRRAPARDRPADRAGGQRRCRGRPGRRGTVAGGRVRRRARPARRRGAGDLALRRGGRARLPAARVRPHRAGAGRRRLCDRDGRRARHGPLRPPKRAAVGQRPRRPLPGGQPARLHRGGEAEPGGVVHERHRVPLHARAVDRGLRPDDPAGPHGADPVARRRRRVGGAVHARALRRVSGLDRVPRAVRGSRPGPVQGPERLRPLPRPAGDPRAARAARAAAAPGRSPVQAACASRSSCSGSPRRTRAPPG